MKKAGVEVVKFTKSHIPFINFFTQLNYRDHRKIVVIDGKIGYTGGMNISDDYFLRWRDTHLRITGNAVSGLQYSFLNTWITAGGSISSDFNNYFPSMTQLEQDPTKANDQVAEIENDLAKTPIENLDMTFKLAGNDKLIQIVPDEPDSQWPIIQMGAVWAVQHAKKYIYIQTPYFVPPDPILSALKSAALSGTDVRIMLPKKADLFFMGPANKSYFSECLEAGIKIYERSGRFIHSKTFVSDDYLSEIGSANMDFRSFTIDYELNAYIYDENTAIVNKAIFMKDMEACKEITLSSWEKRPWYKKLLQRLLRLFAPLL
jgi:cardiolipin synthase